MRKQQTKQGQQSSRSQDQAKGAGQQAQKNVHGEGNYAASKQYNDATRDFAKSGHVDKAAKDAAPTSDAEALQMAGRRRRRQAPREGRGSRAESQEQQPDTRCSSHAQAGRGGVK